MCIGVCVGVSFCVPHRSSALYVRLFALLCSPCYFDCLLPSSAQAAFPLPPLSPRSPAAPLVAAAAAPAPHTQCAGVDVGVVSHVGVAF